MIKILIVSFLTVMYLNNYELKAQDPSFSQFYTNTLYLNPAFAGSTKCPKITINYRNQYPKLQNTYITSSISIDKYVSALQGGLGFMVYNDKQGDGAINTTNVSGIYSYTMNINRKLIIKTGFELSYSQKSFNTNYIFPDMIDELNGNIYTTNEDLHTINAPQNTFDISTGILAFSKTSFFGLSINHLANISSLFNKTTETATPIKYTVHFGTNINIKSKTLNNGGSKISPNIMFQKQANSQQLSYGSYLNSSSLILGAFVRHDLKMHFDSFIMLIGFSKPKFKVAYSYDISLSKQRKETLGAHEISIVTKLTCKQKKKKFKTINCPSF